MKDFRRKENRMEYFHLLYAFNLYHGIMPGLVYRYMPQLSEHFNWDGNQKLWFAFLNGMTQNPITSLRMFRRMPEPGVNMQAFDSWFNENWDNIQFDTDRRYQKKDTPEAIQFYADRVNNEFGGDQEKMYPTTSPYQDTWKLASSLYSFGRLSTFSYLEYVKIMGFGTDCDDLMFRDKSGSKSHRNGMLFLTGQDHLVWDKRHLNSHDGDYGEEWKPMYLWLAGEAAGFLEKFTAGFPSLATHAGNFTMESNLCTFKNHFFGRRYPGVYADMAYGRLLKAKEVRADSAVVDLFEDLYYTLPEGLTENSGSPKPNENERGAQFVESGKPYRWKLVKRMKEFVGV